MFSTAGNVSAPDAYHLIRDAISQVTEEDHSDDPHHIKEAERAFIGFLLQHQKGFLLSPSGDVFEVGTRFLTDLRGKDSLPAYFEVETGLVGRHSPRPGFVRKYIVWMAYSTFLLWFFLSGISLFLFSYLSITGAPEDLPSRLLLVASLVGLSLLFMVFVLPVYRFMKPFVEDDSKVLSDWSGYSVMFERKAVEAFINAEILESVDGTMSDGSLSEAAVAREIVSAYRGGTLSTKSDMLALKTAQGMRVRSFMRAWDKARDSVPEIGLPGRKKTDR